MIFILQEKRQIIVGSRVRNLLSFVCLLCCLQTFGQTDPKGKPNRNELKFDVPAVAFFQTFQASYEIIYEKSGFGFDASIALSDDNYFDNIFLIHLRRYTGRKYASGFFFEVNAGFVTQEFTITINPITGEPDKIEKSTDLGVGFALGVKVSSNKFMGEVFAGLGTIISNGGSDGYPRIGVLIGPRF